MTGGDPLELDGVLDTVRRVCFPARADERRLGRVGIEIERFPVAASTGGAPQRRIWMSEGSPSSLDILDRESEGDEGLRGRSPDDLVPSYPLSAGGRVTFEPGGVIEHATAVHDSPASALAEVEAVSRFITEAFDLHQVALASVGVDPWFDVADVPLQLRHYRYPAMAEYFARRGPWGRIIMRHTASVQINLDLGPPDDRSERWLVTNLVAPLLTATFANSPTPADGWVATRAVAWQRCDPSRTGFPRLFVDGSSDDPAQQMADAALSAEVLLVRTPTGAEPGRPGWTFRDWLTHGHPDDGHRPTADDLAYHLSTVFHEVRARGMLELRSIDAIPHRWRAVPLVLVAGAVEDAATRRRLIELLEPHRAELPMWWHRAARDGVGDPAFCALAVEAWSFALEGAGRLPAGYLPDGGLADVEAFLERYTLRGRAPADELRDLLDGDPGAALAWAAEPVPERTRRGR